MSDKIAANQWERNLDEVIDFIKTYARKDNHEWSWVLNGSCKYISLRFDMRDGAFVILNRNGERISFEDLKFQESIKQEGQS